MALALSVIAREEPELAGGLASAFGQANDVKVTSARVRERWNELRVRMAEPGRTTGLSPRFESVVLMGIAIQLGWRSFSIDAPEMIEELLAESTIRDTARAVRYYTEQALFFRIRARDFAGAKALANSWIERLGAVLGPNHWYLEIYRSALGECLVAEGRYAEALPILERSLAVFAGSVAPDAGAEADVRKRLAQLHEATGHADIAAPHRQALVDFALGYARSIQWSMLRTFLAPPYSEVVASFDAFHELLLTISASGQPVSAHAEELSDLLSRVVDTCRRDCADEDPVGMLLATQLMSRVGTLAEAGVSGPATRQASEEASRMANLHPERRPLMQIIIAAMAYQASLTSGDAAGARQRAQAVDALVARHLAQSVAFDAQPLECASVISSLVTQPRLSAATYDTAARLCLRVLLAAPDRHEYLGVAGAALYRAGRHQEALVQLVESDRLATAPGGAGSLARAETLAFLAMTHQRLGDAASASEALARLGTAVSEAGPGASITVLALLAEAEDLLAARG
jgi:tetratricopeptide (TPR) repeat protein